MKNIVKSLILLVVFTSLLPLAAEIVQNGDEWIVYDEQYSEEISFSHRDVFIEHKKYGTDNMSGSEDGWFPGCSGIMPMGVKFNVEYGAEMGAEMKGRAIARWPEAVKFSFEGEDGDGHSDMYYGIEMEAKWKKCSSGEEHEISQWLNFDLSFSDEKTFQPFLLDGNIDNPVSMEDSIDHFKLYEGTLADMVGGSCGLTIPIIGDICSLIQFRFELDGKMYVEIFGNRIALDEKQERSIFTDNQYIVIDPPVVGTVMQVPVFYESKVYYQTIITLTITLTIKVIDIDFPIPIEIPIVGGDKVWRYNEDKEEPTVATFYFPAIFIENRTHQFADTRPGDEDYWEFEVENIGERALEAKVVSDNAGTFIVTPDHLNLAPGGKGIVTVFFKPYDTGKHTGAIKIYSNDPIEPLTTVSLFGYSSEDDTQWTKVIEGDEPRWEIGSIGGCSTTLIGGEK
ncbi:DUF1573 domain-containing protein [bacterium]|nr:DUF1573 domain-containing protein [bacterium]